MPLISKFQDLKCWQNAKTLTINLYTLTEKDSFRKAFALRNQFRRASLSVMNNIAEGFRRFSPKESIRYMEIAAFSCNEVLSMLYLIRELKMINERGFDDFENLTTLTRGQIMGLIKHLRNRKSV